VAGMIRIRTLRNVVAASVLACVCAATATAQQGLTADAAPSPAYVLGAGDVITIRALDADEISDKPIRLGDNGFITLPLVGRVRASGLTTEQLEAALAIRLKPLIRNPEVSVSVVEQRSQPVSIIGSVNAPGVQQLQGRKTLVEMLSLAGGVRQDAGHAIKITRRLQWGPIPVPGAAADVTGRFSVAEINLKEILEARNPSGNIQIMPDDVISVPRAEMVYVIGEVKKSGGFTIGERESLSTLQALSLAEGLNATAAPQNARILRLDPGAPKRTEISVDLRRILAGKENDVRLEPDDILFIPGSKSKNVAIRSLEAAVQIGTGIAIYHR
jgi:polysaccharide export outer membrane protein